MHAQDKNADVEHPRIVHKTPRLRLWHKLDAASFEMPSAAVYLAFACPEVPHCRAKKSLCKGYKQAHCLSSDIAPACFHEDVKEDIHSACML